MEVSKLVITPQTAQLNLMTRKNRTALRRRVITEYIKSKPSGEIISMHTIQRIANISSYSNAQSFVKRMIRDGVISRHKGDRPKAYYYTVSEATTTVKAPVATGIKTYTLDQIVERAKNYVWEKQDDSLRSFIEELEK